MPEDLQKQGPPWAWNAKYIPAWVPVAIFYNLEAHTFFVVCFVCVWCAWEYVCMFSWVSVAIYTCICVCFCLYLVCMWVCAYVSVCRPMSFLILLYFKVGSFILIHNSHDSACLTSLLVPKIACLHLGIQCMPSCLSDIHLGATDLTSSPSAYTESLLSAKPSLKALKYVIHTRSQG